MNDILTLFRDRVNDQGSFHRRSIQCAGCEYRLYVYAKGGFKNRHLLDKLSFDNQEQYIDQKDQIIKSLKDSEGGWLVDAVDKGNQLIEISIYLIIPQYPFDDSTPINCFCLIPDNNGIEDQSLNFENYQSNGRIDARISRFSIQDGSHIILPVDKHAETRFFQFRTALSKYFPDGFDISALALLRQPSVGLRIDRLERIIDDKITKLSLLPPSQRIVESDTQNVPANKLKDWLSKISMALKQPIISFLLGSSFMGIVISILVETGYMFPIEPRQIGKQQQIVLPCPKPESTPSHCPEVHNPSESRSNTNIISVAKLHEIVDQNRNTNLETLWKHHFNDFNSAPSKELTFSNDICQSNPKACWGLVKLPLIIIMKEVYIQRKELDKKKGTRMLEELDKALLANLGKAYNELDKTKFFEYDEAKNKDNTISAFKAVVDNNIETALGLELNGVSCFLSKILVQLESISPNITDNFKKDLPTIRWRTCDDSPQDIIGDYNSLQNMLEQAYQR